MPANDSWAPLALKSPTYPQRVHIREAATWRGVLADWDARIAEAGRQLDALGASAPAALHRLYAQMLGARDQIADAAARLPMEVGHMYHDDRHRLEEAVAALDRLFQRWEAETPTGR